MAILAVFLLGNDSSIPAITVPDPPTALARNDALTNQTQVSLTWEAPQNDGGEPVIEYTVEIKFADGYKLPFKVTTTSFTFKTSVTSGATYSFRVKAKNSAGFSEYSESLDIIAGTIPEAPANFGVDYAETTADQVLFTWSAP